MEHIITYQEFAESPAIIDNPNLVVKIANRSDDLNVPLMKPNTYISIEAVYIFDFNHLTKILLFVVLLDITTGRLPPH